MGNAARQLTFLTSKRYNKFKSNRKCFVRFNIGRFIEKEKGLPVKYIKDP